MAIGTHLLLDCYDVPTALLVDADHLARMLTDAARAAAMTPLSEPVVHVFSGGGVTAFLPLAESHMALHTYPEHAYLAADIFTCGPDPGAPDRAVEIFQARLAPARVDVRREARGAN